MKKLEDDLVAPDAMHATHDQIERMVVTEDHKILRAMLQQHYNLRAALEREVAVKAIGRQKRDRLRQSIRRLETLAGEVEVQRTLYQGKDVPYLTPLEGVLALPRDKYSHEVRRIAAEESARSSPPACSARAATSTTTGSFSSPERARAQPHVTLRRRHRA